MTLDDPVESYVPEVGPGFAGRTVGDVASMAVNHHVAELTYVESRYYKSAIHNEYGLGHSGWGGQLLWADPESGTIIAANSLLASELPAPHDHFNKLYHAAIDIVTHFRAAD